MMDCEKRQI